MAAISKEHTSRGIQGGFIQVCHGKKAPLQKMKMGDYIIVYSSKVNMSDTIKYQKFTAIGRVSDNEVYPFQMTPDFCPFRRKIEFLECQEVSIIDLIPDLQFIENKQRWGYPFRFGFFEISEHDYQLISSKMLLHDS